MFVIRALAAALVTGYHPVAIQMRLIKIDGVGHPWMDLKRESSGVTAQRWQANQDLGDLGEPDGGGRWPPPNSPKEKSSGRLRSLTA